MSGLFSSFPSFWSIRPQTSFRMIAGCSQKRNTLKFVLFSPNFFFCWHEHYCNAWQLFIRIGWRPLTIYCKIRWRLKLLTSNSVLAICSSFARSNGDDDREPTSFSDIYAGLTCTMTSTFMLCLRIERSFPFYIQAIFYGHSQHSHCISKKRIYVYIFCWPMAFSRNVRIVASFVFGDVIFLVLFHIADGFSAYILLPDFHRSLSRHPISYTSGTWACLPEQHQPLPRHVSRSRYSLWLDNIIRILFVDAVAIFFISSLLFVHDFLDYYLIYRRTYCVKGDIILLFFFFFFFFFMLLRPPYET